MGNQGEIEIKRIKDNYSKSMKNKLNILEKIYLNLSDCDGMCNHCEPKLKKICDKNKNIKINVKQLNI
jgi:hypothetical protein